MSQQMHKYQHHIYYEYDGPTSKNLFKEKKSDNEVSEALKGFKEKLLSELPPTTTVVFDRDDSGLNSMVISIETALDKESMYGILEKLCIEFGLRGPSLEMKEKLRKAQAILKSNLENILFTSVAFPV